VDEVHTPEFLKWVMFILLNFSTQLLLWDLLITSWDLKFLNTVITLEIINHKLGLKVRVSRT